MRPICLLCLCALAALSCTAEPSAPAIEGPLGQHLQRVSSENAVPRDLVLAIAHVEGGLLLSQKRLLQVDDEVPVGGILELRHGAFNSLKRGAELMQTTEELLREDTDLGTEAGAKVLAELGRETGASPTDLGSWRAAATKLSGLRDSAYRDEYLRDVFGTLRRGGDFMARGGERLHLQPHPELSDAAIGTVRQELGGPPPDYAGATWFTTDCTNKCTPGRPDGNASVDTIVIHDTEGGWSGSVATLQSDPGKSVHYIIDADGKRVGQFLHETETAWHAGNFCINKHSIGIEHVGYASDPGYQTGLYATSVKLVQSIRQRWKVPVDRTHIIGHYQVPNGNVLPQCSTPCTDALNKCETSGSYGGASNHRDPGLRWQWCQYLESLGGSCTCNDTYPLWNCTTDKTEAVRCNAGKVEIADCSPCEPQPTGVSDICHVPDGGTPPRPDAGRPPVDAGAVDAGTADSGKSRPDAQGAPGEDAAVAIAPADAAAEGPDAEGATQADAPSGSAKAAAPSGCGCATGGDPLSLAAGLSLLAMLRRRSRVP